MTQFYKGFTIQVQFSGIDNRTSILVSITDRDNNSVASYEYSPEAEPRDWLVDGIANGLRYLHFRYFSTAS